MIFNQQKQFENQIKTTAVDPNSNNSLKNQNTETKTSKPNQSNSQKQQSQQGEKITYKSKARIFFNVCTVALGSFYFGYSLYYFSVVPIDKIILQFHINLSANQALGIFSALIPIGAAIGALLSSPISRYFSRRSSLIISSFIAAIGTLLIQVTQQKYLFVGRLIQGICLGLFSSLCPLIIKQLCPIELSGSFGAIHPLFIISGILTAVTFGMFLPKDIYQIGNQWRIIFIFPLVIVICLVLLLVLVFKNQTPKYLILNGIQYHQIGQIEQAQQLISQLYKQQYTKQIYQNIVEKIQLQRELQLKKQKKFNLSTIIAMHLSILQQMSGINIIVLYLYTTLNVSLPKYGKIIQIIIMSMKLVLALVETKILHVIGRKKLLQFGTLVSSILLFIFGTVYLEMFNKNQMSDAKNFVIVICLFTYMSIFSMTLGPVVWLYIPQIVQPNIVPFSTLINWATASIVILLFPILGEYLGHSALFYFMSLWCIISYHFNKKYLVQTKGKTEKEIFIEFQNL